MAATPATVALDRAGVDYTQHRYAHGRGAGSFGEEASQALGLRPEEVFKTLLAEADGTLVVAVVPVAGRLDLKALASAVGAKRATMAEPGRAERVTGYVVGGISPLGQRTALRTVVDSSAEALPRVYVSGGRRGLDLGLAPGDLVRVTGADLAPIKV